MMAQTPIVLLATDYLLKGEGLSPSIEVTRALGSCTVLRGFSKDNHIDPTIGSAPEWAEKVDELPRVMVLDNVQNRINDLLPEGEQGIRKFISIFQAAGGASAMTTGTIDAAAALKNFKSFSDFGPGITNIQDLVTGGKTGSFPGGADAMTKLGDGLKGMGSMFDPEALGNMGDASSLVKNLGSQGVLPSSISDKIQQAGIDLDNMTDADQETVKKLMSEVKGADLEAITKATGFAPGKLSNLSDALNPSKILPAGSVPGLSGSDGMAALGASLQSVAGTGNPADIGKKLANTRVPELRHLMAAPPDFSKVGESLKSKFTTVSLPAVPDGLPADFAAKLRPDGIDKLSIPSMPGHVPNVPSMPGVPSIPLEVSGYAAGGAIDTSMYTKTADEDLTYTGDDYIVWDRVNTERLNRGLPDLAALGTPRPAEPPVPATATPNGTPGVFQMLGTLSVQGPIYPLLVELGQVEFGPGADVTISNLLAKIQIALDQEAGALEGAGINLGYPGPTGYVGVTTFAEKLHQYGVDKQNIGLGKFIEELASADLSAAGDSIIAALYEGRNLAA
jgi:hypothetical protein